MVKNIGSYIRIYCMEHDKPVPYIGVDNHPWFACGRTYRKDDEHEDGYEEPGQKCVNILRYNDYVKIVDRISEIVEGDTVDKAEAHYKGLRFVYKNIEVVVLKHTDKHIDLGIRYLKRSLI